MKIPSCASLHRSAAASAKSWNDPQVAHPTRSPEIPAVPTNLRPATRSPVQNRCLQNSPAVTTESRSPASPTDAHCSLRRTSRIPSPQSHQTSLPPKVHSLSYKMDGPAPSLPHRGCSIFAPAAVSAFASPSPSVYLQNAFAFYERQSRIQVTSGYISTVLTFATGCYLNLIWLNAEVGTGGGDVAGGADFPPTDTQLDTLRLIEIDM